MTEDMRGVWYEQTPALMHRPFSWESVAGLYQAPQRAYHDLRHIHAMLREVRQADVSKDERQWLEAVVWLHDAFYDPLASSPANEQCSADLVHGALGKCFTHTGRALAEQTIMATAHHLQDQPNLDPLTMLLLDIDLAQMGQQYDLFLRNTQLVSQEFRNAGVSDDDLIIGHHRFFQQLLQRQCLYYTSAYQDRDAVARENIAQALHEKHRLVEPPQTVGRAPSLHGKSPSV